MNFKKIAKKILPEKAFKKAEFIYNFNEEVLTKFVTETVRTDIKPGSKILDAGAGPVKYKKYFSDCDYFTQDFQQYKDPLNEFKYGKLDYVSDITAIPVEDNSFDAVICTEVIEHVPRPDLAIKEFSRVLKPGGKIYLTSCLGSGEHQMPFHFYGGFSKFWYRKFLTDYGFVDINLKKKGGFFTLYAAETQRAFIYLGKSKKLTHIIFKPIFIALRFILPPMLFSMDRDNLDKADQFTEFTIGYLVIAKKS